MATLVGNTSQDGSADGFSTGACYAGRYVCGTTGTATTVSLYAKSSSNSNNVKFAIYADSAGAPGALLGQTSQITIQDGVAGLHTGTLTSSVAVNSGTTYWLAMLCLDGNVDITTHADAGNGYKGHDSETAFQNPFGSSANTFADNNLPIQADGTAGGGIAGGGGGVARPGRHRGRFPGREPGWF